jgi:hypothetical protein
MSLTLPEPAAADPHGNDSYNSGELDGELAAITGLSSERVHARATMAHPYDPDYATGYIDGYLAEIERAYAIAETTQDIR